MFFISNASSQLTVLEILSASTSNSHFNEIVANDEVNAFLASESGVTVLVPDNDAVDAYATAMGMTTEAFIASESAIEMAWYHIVPNEEILFGALTADSVVTTASGMPVSFHVNGTVNATAVAASDLEASNGVLHLLDEVVVLSEGMYQWLDASSQHNYITIAMDYLGLEGTFSAIGAGTIFAPTDAAFLAYANENDLSIIDIVYNPDFMDALLRHSIGAAAMTSEDLLVVGSVLADSGDELFITESGESVYVNTAEVTNPDNLTQNGLVHVVNEVIMPTYFLSDAIEDAGLTLLDTLLTLTGLLDELSVPANYTVFAPTDSAITAFLEAEELTLDELLLDADGLTDGLLLHVVGDFLGSTDLQDGDLLMTLAGDPVLVEVAEGAVLVGGAAVVQADIPADNGILHLMGSVLSPYIQGCMDEEACNYDDDATVDDGSCYQLEVITSTVDNVCVGGADGIIYVDVTNAPDAVLLGDYQGQQVLESEDGVFSGLLSGTYMIHVEDTAGCTTAVAVDINDPTSSALTVSVNSTPDDGSGSGTVMAVPSGGIPPYDITWYDEAMNEAGDVYLSAGTYTVVVTDNLGCSIEASVEVESGTSIGESVQSAMVFYPNPTGDLMQVKNLPPHWTSLRVFNAAGVECKIVQPTATETVLLDASSWATGVYLLQVCGPEAVVTRRFTVAR
ncbi:MAG: fasciclin domain-containing protein [Flavobacteriales bacterium]